MIKYPIEFACSAEAKSGVASNWSIRSSEAEAACCVPREFDGPGGAFSPEDLYAQALTNCFLATFKVYAQGARLDYARLSAEARLVVDLDETKRPVMKSFALRARIESPTDVDRAKRIAQKAFDSGFILNSVKTDRSFEFEIG